MMLVWMMCMCVHVVWAALHSVYEQGHDLVLLLADDVLAATPDCCWDAYICQLLDAALNFTDMVVGILRNIHLLYNCTNFGAKFDQCFCAA